MSLLIVYTFFLFIVLIPNYLFKTSPSLNMNILHSVIFTLIYLLTHDLVKEKEGFGTATVTVVGTSRLEKLVNALFPDDPPKFDIINGTSSPNVWISDV